MKSYIIWVIITLVIIVYWIYLIYKKGRQNNEIEGFDTSNAVKMLVETSKNKNFSLKVWDNQTFLVGLYLDQNMTIPVNYKECLSVNQKNASDLTTTSTKCPISIWRPFNQQGYFSVGDVITRSFISPSNEVVTDIRVAKTPGAINDKGLDTLSVIGSALKEPEDFVYIGSFGTGEMINSLETNDKFNRIKQIIKNNYVSMVKNMDTIITKLKSEVNQAKLDTLDIFAEQLYKITKSYKAQPINQNTLSLLKEAYNNYAGGNKISQEKEKVVAFINTEKNKPISSLSTSLSNTITYEIEKRTVSLDVPYQITELLKTFSENMVKNILNFINLQKLNQQKKIEFNYYVFRLKNLNIIPTINTNPTTNPADITGKYIADKLHIIGVNPGTPTRSGHIYKKYVVSARGKRYRANGYYFLHSELPIGDKVEATIDYSLLFDKRNKPRLKDVIYKSNILDTSRWKEISNINDENADKTILSFHTRYSTAVHPQILDIYSLEYTVNRYIVDNFNNNIIAEQNVINNYNILVKEIQEFADTSNLLNDYNYKALSIWQPIPPPGYVAMGFVFLNSDNTVKPRNDMIMCIPETCAKSFKRRQWLPEDLIFKYVDNTQQLAFYRNPYVGTVVVIDEKKNNGEFNGNLPNQMKYRNDPKSPNWECFDIVACIKESDFINNLDEGQKKSVQMCKSYRGLENQTIEKKEKNKIIKKEEEKMKRVLSQKKKYIDDLMKNLNEMMNDEELYKMINRGLNRYKMKTKLEHQRNIHEKVADKMMRTRGLEISLDNPVEFGQFKDNLQKFVVARGLNLTSSEEPDNCPVCKLPDTTDMVNMNDLKMCYGCVEDVVREMIGSKKAAGEEIPPELLELENSINQKQ
jgi:hypothetical protein